MATTFPTAVDSFATNIDGVSVVTAADMNNVQDAIVALEAFVGLNPPPDYLNTFNALVRRAADGDIAAQDIIAVGQLISTAAGGGALSGLFINSALPAMAMRRSDAGPDNKLYDEYLSTTQKISRLVSDDGLSAFDWATLTRSGITVTSYALACAVAISGILVASSGVAAPRSSGSALFAMDASNTGLSMTVANAAASYIFAGSPTNNFAGLIMVNETSTDKSSAVFLVGASTCTLLGEAGAHWAASNTASKSCVYNPGNSPVIHNNRGGSRTYNIVAIRLAASN